MVKIEAAGKREKDWLDQAERAETAYLNDDKSDRKGTLYNFNILHSNIETMVPATFNSAPVPDIRERFRTGRASAETSVAQQVAQVFERAITVQCDDGALEAELEEMTQDALLTGRGGIRVKFDVDEAEGVLSNERLTFESVSWRDYREGPAKRWRDVPWIAMRHCLPWEAVQKIKDPELKAIMAAGGEGSSEPEADSDTHIWEIWCKETRKVYKVVGASGDVLSIIEDPLGLRGFFPMPQPVQPIGATGTRVPVCPFHIYKMLADEAEKATKRIEAITDGLRVRGLIVGSAEDIADLALAKDNEFIPIANMEGFAATGGLENAIVWWPVEKAIVVLRELYASREQTKQMIYEVTGISDIVRGQSNANETLGAQEIKSQWGSLRLQKLQRLVQQSARDMFVICAELISSKFSPETLGKMTGVEMTPEMAGMLQRPLDYYRIDVETDSTIRADLSRRKGEMGEFLQGTASFFQAMAPVVEQAPEMAGPVAELFGAFARQFSLGKQAEDALEDITQQAKQAAAAAAESAGEPDPMEQQAMAEAEAKQAELAMKQQDSQAKMQLDMQKAQADMQAEAAKLNLETQKAQADAQLAAAKLELDREKLAIDRERMAMDRENMLLDRERMATDSGRADREFDLKAGVIQPALAPAIDGMIAALAEMQQRQAVTAQALAQGLAEVAKIVAAGDERIVAAMSQPKELVRDASGRISGVRPA
jgi:hypothetical protein